MSDEQHKELIQEIKDLSKRVSLLEGKMMATAALSSAAFTTIVALIAK